MDELKALIERLVSSRELFVASEEATKQGAILPIIARLGWDRDNIRQVCPEFSAGNGRVDYCLRLSEQSKVFIEAKRMNEDLNRHEEQLLDYAFRQGVELAVLTNGILWWFYLPLSEGSWDERKFFAIDLQNQETAVAADYFHKFLHMGNVQTGQALQNAKDIHSSARKKQQIADTIPRAWRELCQDPDELLLEIFADKVEGLCGYRPDFDKLAEYIGVQVRPPTPNVGNVARSVARPAPAQPRIDNQAMLYTGTRPTQVRLLGQSFQVSTYNDVLILVCESLLRRDSQEFSKVLQLRGRERPYFSLRPEELRSPKQLAGANIYVETNLSANNVMKILFDVLALLGHSPSQLVIDRHTR